MANYEKIIDLGTYKSYSRFIYNNTSVFLVFAYEVVMA